MRLIESEQNKKFKSWKQLLSARGRKKEGAFLVESRKLIAEALLSSLKPGSLVFQKSHFENSFSQLLDQLQERGANDRKLLKEKIAKISFVLDDSLFTKLTQMQSPDGILAIFEGSLKKSFSELDVKKIKGKILLCDYIQDPGNAGAIFRSAEAFGFGPIFLVDSVDVENQKCLRSSMGAAFRLDFYDITEKQAIFLKKELSLPWYAADMKGEDYRTINYPDDLILLIGNEGNGLRSSFQAQADKIVKIPMKEPVESLNAAVSASILMARFSQSLI